MGIPNTLRLGGIRFDALGGDLLEQGAVFPGNEPGEGLVQPSEIAVSPSTVEYVVRAILIP